jgi:hypothetical protein
MNPLIWFENITWNKAMEDMRSAEVSTGNLIS